LAIARGTFRRPSDVLSRRPAPRAPRGRRLEVAERLGARGEVLVPLDEAAVRNAARALAAEGVESVAVTFLFSYLDPVHERRAAAFLPEGLPAATTSASHPPSQDWRGNGRPAATL